jgi:hypothetical protein
MAANKADQKQQQASKPALPALPKFHALDTDSQDQQDAPAAPQYNLMSKLQSVLDADDDEEEGGFEDLQASLRQGCSSNVVDYLLPCLVENSRCAHVHATAPEQSKDPVCTEGVQLCCDFCNLSCNACCCCCSAQVALQRVIKNKAAKQQQKQQAILQEIQASFATQVCTGACDVQQGTCSKVFSAGRILCCMHGVARPQ